MLTIDGSRGEGGGQILRTSLALSLVTGRPFRIERIRARRRRPGLMRQHWTAVEAAARIGAAEVEGAALGSSAIAFRPRSVLPGEYRFSVGTAGSTTLVLQTVLPALITASAPSSLRLEGGTHNPFAPPFEFLEQSFLPLVERMGPRVHVKLERHGFHPAGGGSMTVRIDPVPRLGGLRLDERGAIHTRRVTALLARLADSIGRREIDVARRELGWDASCCEIRRIEDSAGPGNLVHVEIGCEHVTELITAFGRRGLPAERVAAAAVADARRYLESGAAVGDHLADQLMLPLALSDGGGYTTLEPSSHTRTNAMVIRAFLERDIGPRPIHDRLWQVHL